MALLVAFLGYCRGTIFGFCKEVVNPGRALTDTIKRDQTLDHKHWKMVVAYTAAKRLIWGPSNRSVPLGPALLSPSTQIPILERKTTQ